MRKKWILLLFGGVLLFLFILSTSYAWYNLFEEEVELTTNLEIKIQDNGQGVVIEEAVPMSDKEGKQIGPYLFEVKNTGEAVGNYKLIIEETPFNEIKDGCTTSTLLDRTQLRYQLLLNGNEIAIGDLDDVKNNILDLRTIKEQHENRYELRVWVSESASETEWQNKHYHYSIVIIPFLAEEDH